MKSASLIMSLSLALTGAAMAQQSRGIQGSATGDARATATADEEGASVSGGAAGAASATTNHASGSIGQGTELNATLSKPVDARSAQAGDEVTATVSEDIKSNGKVLIRKGSKLVGHVTTAHPVSNEKGSADGRGGSQLGIVFDRAVLKDGATLPISATVQALAAAESSASMGMGEANAGLGGAGSAAGSARSGGGLVGGVAGGASGAIGGVAGRTGAVTSGSVSASNAALSRSAGAVGGLNAAGRLASGSKGTFGLNDIEVSPATSADAKGAILSSAKHNVRLDRGTRMLLVNGSAAGAASVTGSQSRATAPSESAPPPREPVDRR